MKGNINMRNLVLILVVVVIVSFTISGTYFYLTMATAGDFVNFEVGVERIIDEEKTFDVESTEEIYIDSTSTDVSIIPVDDNKIKVRLYGKFKANKNNKGATLTANISNNKLNIQVKHKDNFIVGFYSGIEKLDVYIPKNYTNDITIKSSSADVDVSNMSINSLDFKTDSGNLLMESFSSKKTVIKTSSGDVEANGFNGDLNVDSSSGDVEIEYEEFNNNIDITSSSGDVTLKLPVASQFHLKAKTSSGDIMNKFPISVVGEIEDDFLEGYVGNSDSKIIVHTDSGNIIINN
ncbi:DUF4097 family beta strand repeat-containing protein [Brassicibacter mesophilus]|uniref:DUF4097 family beta strand repeat-containing protein n=1 Tax=Brassicibacter mesophilus TaxID=745119 RepID=UPI003D1D87CB